MANMVTHEFTLDNENVYIVTEGTITRELRTFPLSEYAKTKSNVGYLDPDRQEALMIRKNDIVRISYDAFMELRKSGERSRGQLDGILKITYDAEVFTSKILGVRTDYKLADRPGGDFDNLELGASKSDSVFDWEYASNLLDWIKKDDASYIYDSLEKEFRNRNVQGIADALAYKYKFGILKEATDAAAKKLMELCTNVGVKTKKPEAREEVVDINGIPYAVQTLAVSTVGRNITADEIEVYRRIVISVNNGGKFSVQAWDDKKLKLFDKLYFDNIVVRNKFDDSTYIIAVPDVGKLSYMRKVIELYDAASDTTNHTNPMAVATAAMNLSLEERERIGLVNATVQNNMQKTQQSNVSTSITVGSIHRPRSLCSTKVFPFEHPCVVRKTAPYYTMLAMNKQFIEYSKPVEAFFTANITLDKRVPMRVVPMVTSDMHGYAYPKRVDGESKLVSDKCIPIATGVPGVYWMFYEMKRAVEIEKQEFQFISDALIDYIDANSASFDLSATGVVASVASGINTSINELGYDNSNKQEVIAIYKKFFEETGKGLFRIMKVSYKSGFVIAMTRDNTQVLLTSVIINSDIDYSQYPEHITVIPIEGDIGLLVVGAEPSDISRIERVMTGAETIEDDGDYDQPDD